jgi:UDP-glucose 4-epimerase
VLVTGCSRFLGEAIVRALRQKNHSVIATALHAREGVAALDVRDERAVDQACSKADAIIHLAAVRTYGDPSAMAYATAVIIDGTRAVVRAAKRHGLRVIIAGSGEEYGATGVVPFREEGPYAPVSEYGRAKRAAVVEALEQYPEGTCVLRPSTVYGAAQPAMMLVAQCLRAARENGVVRIHGGEQTRDHVYVDDVADAFVRAVIADAGICGHEINIATGQAHSVRFIAERVLAIAGRGRLEVGPASRRAGDVMEASFCVERARWLLGWQAETSLEDGLTRTVRATLTGP